MSEKRDPRSFLASALVLYGYGHEVAEKLVQQALDQHAHELAEKIRNERDAADVPGSPFTPHMARGADWAADLIDPEKEGL